MTQIEHGVMKILQFNNRTENAPSAPEFDNL